MSGKPTNVADNVSIKHFHTTASFDKIGFLSIVLHVFFSLHYHGVVKTEDYAIDFSLYFGCFCNGTVQLVKVWQYILANNVEVHDQFAPSSVEGNLFRLLERADLKCFLAHTIQKPADKTKWNQMTGNSQIPRYQFNTRGPPAIKLNLQLIRGSIKKILKHYREATPVLSSEALHQMFHKELSKFNSIGPMRCNQLFSSLCLTGLFPIQAMTECISLSTLTNPGKILKAYKRSDEASIEITLETLMKCLKLHGFNRLTKFFLENMLCELYRHLDKEMRRKLKESMKTEAIYNTLLRDCLADPEYLDRVCNATNSAKPDVYFKDTSKDEWQHLFAIVERN